MRSRLAGFPLAPEDFGKLPGSGSLHQAYLEHAQAEGQNFTDLTELLDGAGEALHGVAGHYRDTDEELAVGLGGQP
ncbi:hypothetical protein ACFYS8_35230 [Kitasatospora sp. NPDC004615]|uniref:hypothetical protein n=1 Tax=unclassified Kitasatospora TaxID=2633591 RepID=UPI00369C9C83